MWEEPYNQKPVYSTVRPIGKPSERHMPPPVKSTGRSDGNEAQLTDADYKLRHGFSKMAPANPEKRQKVQNQAEDELRCWEKYKQQKRPSHVAIKPAASGGWKSEEESRRQFQREQEAKKYEMIRKREQWAREKKEREDKEYAEKKMNARRQTEMNNKKKTENEHRRQCEMARDHKRANEAFLRRFEQKQQDLSQLNNF